MAEVKDVTDNDFATEVEGSQGLVLVDFWASWCGPCQVLAPTIEQIATEMAGQVKVCKLNIDENQNTSQKYGVLSIPTILIFKNGQVVENLVGFRPKEQFVSAINKHLNPS